MSLPRDIVPADRARNTADQDPPSRPVAQPVQPPQNQMDGSQLVQWLSVQAGNMAGDLQHNVRALMVRASSPMPVMDGHDEVSSLRKELRHLQQAHRELQTMLKNQALAIETFQSKWQMAGQEARAFIARTRAQSEDFVRAELISVQRFEESLQGLLGEEYEKARICLQGQNHEGLKAFYDQCRRPPTSIVSSITSEFQACPCQL